MYLKKLERFQKQIEARGEFSLKKKIATESGRNWEFRAFQISA